MKSICDYILTLVRHTWRSYWFINTIVIAGRTTDVQWLSLPHNGVHGNGGSKECMFRKVKNAILTEVFEVWKCAFSFVRLQKLSFLFSSSWLNFRSCLVLVRQRIAFLPRDAMRKRGLCCLSVRTTLIGNYTQSIEWYHFQWPWLALDWDFKVAICSTLNISETTQDRAIVTIEHQ